MTRYALTGGVVGVLESSTTYWHARTCTPRGIGLLYTLSPIDAHRVLRRLAELLDEWPGWPDAAQVTCLAPYGPGMPWKVTVVEVRPGVRQTHLLTDLPGTEDAADWLEAVGRAAVAVANAAEHYDDRAERFHRETGCWAPGKDWPAAAGGRDREADQAAWVAWCAADRLHKLYRETATGWEVVQ